VMQEGAYFDGTVTMRRSETRKAAPVATARPQQAAAAPDLSVWQGGGRPGRGGGGGGALARAPPPRPACPPGRPTWKSPSARANTNLSPPPG
jgi:hypothetical protein